MVVVVVVKKRVWVERGLTVTDMVVLCCGEVQCRIVDVWLELQLQLLCGLLGRGLGHAINDCVDSLRACLLADRVTD